MKRSLGLTGVIMLSALLLSGSAKMAAGSIKYENKNVSNMKENNSYGFTAKEIQPAGYQLIISNTNTGVFVYGKKIGNLPYYEKVLVKTRSAQREFNWKATSRNPGLFISDVTGSGEESIVIVFVTAAGTGFLQSDVHVVNMALTRETPVLDPVSAAKRLITSSVQGKEIVFKSGGAEYRVKLGTVFGEPKSEYSNLQYGSILNYSVENNRLRAGVTVQTASGRFLGEFTLTYSYTGGRLVPRVTSFKSI